MRRIGVDVGGTNTDAVVIDGAGIVAKAKTATTTDLMTGIRRAVAEALARAALPPGSVEAVMVGTTQFTNAVVEGRGLEPVAALRIGLPASRSLGPFCDWPERLASAVRGPVFQVRGGHEVDGRPLAALDEEGIAAAAGRIAAAGIGGVAIASVFSPLNASCEERAAEIVARVCSRCRVTLSHRIGRIGLLARENAALLNAGLRPLAERFAAAMREAMAECALDARLYITQNDGTVLRAGEAQRYPVFSLASGPTNSMRGAAFLSGRSDAVVIDVGGTTSDVGMLQAGFPRQANNAVDTGGVKTLFRMPDLVSIGLGGGSLADLEAGTVGPRSTGHEIRSKAWIFGGRTLTASDLAVRAGLVELGCPARLGALDRAAARALLAVVHRRLADAVDRIKTRAGAVPVLAVGGGAFLVPDGLEGACEVIRVGHGEVANAVGAAMAQVSGECDQVFTGLPREVLLERARTVAGERAVAGGADPATLQTVDMEDLPLSYLPGNAVRARARVIGDITA